MHGIKHCIRERRALCLSAPQQAVSLPAGSNALKRAAAFQSSPGRNRWLVTAFRSPATGAPLRASIPGSNVPGLLLRSPAWSLASPFGFRLRRQFRFAPGFGGIYAPARCPFASSRNSSSSGLHSPLGPFDPSGSERSAGIRPFGSPSDRARSPLTPRHHVLLLVAGNGSLFETRYASGGLLFLKPLGTFSNMRPNPFFVNGFSRGKAGFSSRFISFQFSDFQVTESS